jgi:uncharacterized protein YdbL (DUF1318 family)
MKKLVLFLMLGVIFGLGCARVRVEAPKEPIKVDISMRLDIYQHIQKDIDAIESIVSGSQTKSKKGNNQSWLGYFVSTAFAEEVLNPEVEQAALRRRERISDLNNRQSEGVIGENKSGLVEIRALEKTDSALEALVKAENSDRMIIYEAVAKKNNTSVEEVQKLYAQRLKKDAPAGTPIEVLNEVTGKYEWKVK